jgi:hypothetical protein
MSRKIEPVLYNRTQASQYLGVDRGYLNFLIEKGEVIEIRLPLLSELKGRRIPKKSLDEFIERKMYRNINGSDTLPAEYAEKFLKIRNHH